MSLQGLLGKRLRGQSIPTPRQVDSFFETYARDPDAPLPYFRTMEKRGDDPEPTLQTMEWRGPERIRIQLLSADATDEAPRHRRRPNARSSINPRIASAVS